MSIFFYSFVSGTMNLAAVTAFSFALLLSLCLPLTESFSMQVDHTNSAPNTDVEVHQPIRHDILQVSFSPSRVERISTADTQETYRMNVPKCAAEIEQTTQGEKPAPEMVAGFDGLGVGFEGPQGTSSQRNPSDNTLAVGPNHIVQIVNTRMAIFTKKGNKYDTTGEAIYGPVQTRNVFRGFGGPCEQQNNGDAVVRYDQLAGRWLIVMPIFSRIGPEVDRPPRQSGEPARQSLRGHRRISNAGM